MSVSYADAASTKVPTKSEEALDQQVPQTAVPATDAASIPAVNEESVAVKDERKTQTTPKTLAPAPVPVKSVWATTIPLSPAPLVDEHKFPAPGQVPQAAPNTAKSNAKFGKSNKWIPITAKVVFTSPRNTPPSSGSGSSLKGKRKGKQPRKKSASSAPNGESLAKKEDSSSAPKLDSESDAASNESHTESYAPQSSGDQEHGSTLPTDSKNRSQPSNSNYNQQKGYKKYPNGSYGIRGPTSQQQMPIHRHQGNNYYQPMVTQQYAGNGKQYRLMPTPYGRNGSNGSIPMASYIPANGVRNMSGMPFIPHHPQPMMSGMPYVPPMPIQIPPPLSPKQNPQQALTRQIDYYFSLDNLLRDLFLRKNMGTEGWVDLDLILNFKRVEIIVNGLRNSLEETDEKVKEEKLDKAIVQAVHQCENLEIGYLNGKEDYNVSATEMQLRVKYSFEQWLLPDNL